MKLEQYLDVHPDVAAALAAGRPVVALESTIISHGMPYPQNVETALAVEELIRANGATPATIAIIGGRLKAGLTHEEIEHLGKAGAQVAKASRRDLAVLAARAASAGSTAGPSGRWTSPPTWRSWPRRRCWWSARARSPSSTWA